MLVSKTAADKTRPDRRVSKGIADVVLSDERDNSDHDCNNKHVAQCDVSAVM